MAVAFRDTDGEMGGVFQVEARGSSVAEGGWLRGIVTYRSIASKSRSEWGILQPDRRWRRRDLQRRSGR